MKEVAPVGKPFIGEPRVAGRPAHVAKAPPFCPKVVVVELRGR
jgi:hypothetical protein